MAKLTIREPNREPREAWIGTADDLELVITPDENGGCVFYAMLYQHVNGYGNPEKTLRQLLASASLSFLKEKDEEEVITRLQRRLLSASTDQFTIMPREEGHA